MQLAEIQRSIREAGLDGWLFFDHHHRDPIAYRILGLPETLHVSRRWYYFVPGEGEPHKLVSRIEPNSLDGLPGAIHGYSPWTEQHEILKTILGDARTIAMQYSPDCAVPYVSLVDAGTVELVRSFGVEVKTSADLVSQFEAAWSDDQFQMHFEAGKLVESIKDDAFRLIGDRLRGKQRASEFEAQQFILTRFAEAGLTTDDAPIVAVNEDASNPHFSPSQAHDRQIQADQLVLIDLWAKLNRPNSVFFDITWVGYTGRNVPSDIQNVFEAVRDARNAACDFVISNISAGNRLAGFQVDDIARDVIRDRGFAQYFVHRTGHSIGTDVHGSGANMDNFESHEERRLIPNTCFSVEPGVYLPEFGIRSEVNMFVGERKAMVTGTRQNDLLLI